MNKGLKHLAPIRPLVAVDLETTGTDVEQDRIVEFAAVKAIPGGQTCWFNTRVNPGRSIPVSATRVHGITDAGVVGARLSGRSLTACFRSWTFATWWASGSRRSTCRFWQLSSSEWADF